jgi:NAD(P)-dependent dehydrogenase (short-subunit alcohol dehydrogenase family)
MSNSKKTVFITGASSGIGAATALYFYERDWNVVATMRHPETRKTLLHEKGLPDLVHLDVMDKASVQTAIQYAVEKYQRIDVLVNNAGYAAFGPFEATTTEQVQREFDTNLFGLMEVSRQFLPLFREQKGGMLINVSSMGGRVGFPMYSIYNSTKWAVEGFSEALQYELKPLNIKVKVIEPGVIQTDFYDRSLDKTDVSPFGDAYSRILAGAEKNLGNDAVQKGAKPLAVAQTIYRAANDSSLRLRYAIGQDASLVWMMRRLLPESSFFRLIEKVILG